MSLTDLDGKLAAAFAAAGLPGEGVRAVPATLEGFDLQCNGVMAAAKRAGQKPQEAAEAVAQHLRADGAFETVEVTGPGFLNLRIADTTISAMATAMMGARLVPIVPESERETIYLDFGGPNVAKPLHVGHLRSLVIGESIRRILRDIGHSVISDIHLGDWGLQMGMLVAHVEEAHPGVSPDDLPLTAADLERLYPEAAAACRDDPGRMERARQATVRLQAGEPYARAVWARLRAISLADQMRDIASLGAHFDLLLGESDADPHIPRLLDELRGMGLLVESEGAEVIEIAQPGDKKPMPPLLVRKSDGAALYATTDLATLDLRTRMDADRVVYVVDQRQSLHFEQVFRAARRMGMEARLDHVGFGTVNGPDSKPFKTREGGVARLSTLLDEAIAVAASRLSSDDPKLARTIGIGAVKFADLSSHRLTGYVFDPARFVSFEGRTGPYIQYAAVRSRGILRKSAEIGDAIRVGTPEERALALECLRFPARVQAAADGYAPNEIADYLFGLAQAFSRFYTENPVLNAEDPEVRKARMVLCLLTARILDRGLFLLGIDVPERM